MKIDMDEKMILTRSNFIIEKRLSFHNKCFVFYWIKKKQFT